MSVATQIARIQAARNTIRTKLVALGLVQNTADIDACASAVDGIENRGAVSAQVQEGDTYTIPKGYHNGNGTVSGVSGGGNYSLQAKTVTPTKSQQNVTPDSGYYGLSGVTVGAIPENYQDVSPVTAKAADVLANKIIVDTTGKSVAGTMPNNGKVTKTLHGLYPSYIIPKGYHDGTGEVNISPSISVVTPTKSAQDISPTSGTVFTRVEVKPIPDAYQDVTGVTAKVGNVLAGDVFVDSQGKALEGTMPNNGDTSDSIDGMTVTSVKIPAGYTSGGTVSLTNDIETALAAI